MYTHTVNFGALRTFIYMVYTSRTARPAENKKRRKGEEKAGNIMKATETEHTHIYTALARWRLKVIRSRGSPSRAREGERERSATDSNKYILFFFEPPCVREADRESNFRALWPMACITQCVWRSVYIRDLVMA